MGLISDFKLFFKWLEETQGADSAKIWREIKEVVAKSLLPSERFFTGAISKIVKQRSHAFEVFGYDILLDQQYKPWLLEINHTPSLAPGTNLENNVKHTMLRDLFTLVDVRAQHKPVLGQQCALVWDSILQSVSSLSFFLLFILLIDDGENKTKKDERGGSHGDRGL